MPVTAPAELRTAGMHRMLRRIAQDQAFTGWLRDIPTESYHCVFVTCEFAHAQVAGFILVIEQRIGWCTLHPLPAMEKTSPPKLPPQERTAALLNLLGQGNFEAFAAQLPVPIGSYLGAPGVAAMWKMFQDRFGPLQSFEIAPEPPGDVVTTVSRCLFERGQLTCRAEWSDRLVSLTFD